MNESLDLPVVQILSDRGPVMLANLQGASNPVAILEDTVLDLLAAQCRSARDEALANPGDASVGAVMALCATLSGVLDEYRSVRNKFYGGIGGEQESAAILRDFGQLFKALKPR